MEKHYNNLYGRAGPYIGKLEYRGSKPKFQGRKTTYSDPYRPQPIELDSTQQRKGKNPRGSKGNKNSKTCYNYSKPGHFARECRSIKVLRRQLNATLKVPDDQEEISREDNDSKDSDPLGTSSDKEFQFIGNVELSQEAEDHALLKKQIGLLQPNTRLVFEQIPILESVRQVITERLKIPYLKEIKNAYDEQANTKTSLQKSEQDEEAKEITDILKRQLGSNASKEKVIPKLQRKDATISKGHAKISYIFYQNEKCEAYKKQKYICLSQTACYDNDYQVHALEKDGAGWYPLKLKRRAPKAIKIDYNNTCRYPGYVTYNRHECQKK